MAIVLNRTTPIRHPRKHLRLRYEVVLFQTEEDMDNDKGFIIAKFAYKGDAFGFACSITDTVYRVVVRN